MRRPVIYNLSPAAPHPIHAGVFVYTSLGFGLLPGRYVASVDDAGILVLLDQYHARLPYGAWDTRWRHA